MHSGSGIYVLLKGRGRREVRHISIYGRNVKNQSKQREEKMMREWMAKFREKLKSNSGVGTIEIILILVVLVALVLIFKNQILALASTIFGQIGKSVKSVY
jgi:hypothetical protein